MEIHGERLPCHRARRRAESRRYDRRGPITPAERIRTHRPSRPGYTSAPHHRSRYRVDHRYAGKPEPHLGCACHRPWKGLHSPGFDRSRGRTSPAASPGPRRSKDSRSDNHRTRHTTNRKWCTTPQLAWDLGRVGCSWWWSSPRWLRWRMRSALTRGSPGGRGHTASTDAARTARHTLAGAAPRHPAHRRTLRRRSHRRRAPLLRSPLRLHCSHPPHSPRTLIPSRPRSFPRIPARILSRRRRYCHRRRRRSRSRYRPTLRFRAVHHRLPTNGRRHMRHSRSPIPPSRLSLASYPKCSSTSRLGSSDDRRKERMHGTRTKASNRFSTSICQVESLEFWGGRARCPIWVCRIRMWCAEARGGVRSADGTDCECPPHGCVIQAGLCSPDPTSHGAAMGVRTPVRAAPSCVHAELGTLTASGAPVVAWKRGWERSDTDAWFDGGRGYRGWPLKLELRRPGDTRRGSRDDWPR